MKKCTDALLSFLSAAADKMAIQSLSEVSSAGWYQPEIDDSIICSTIKANDKKRAQLKLRSRCEIDEKSLWNNGFSLFLITYKRGI